MAIIILNEIINAEVVYGLSWTVPGRQRKATPPSAEKEEEALQSKTWYTGSARVAAHTGVPPPPAKK